VSVEIIPVRGIPEIVPGDDLAAILAEALAAQGTQLQDGDAVVLTQKIVSKAEGRLVAEEPDGKASWVARETRRVVARKGDLVIAETRHGFVCANAGVDASNVAEGHLTLLPEDPDESAQRIRASLGRSSGAEIAVLITDTFGRAWREGLVNVAIGCAGLPALVDLRGTKDAVGRILEATVEALADEVAAASGLVMGKADGVPVAVIRGLHAEGPLLPASSLVRQAGEDLFRESPLQALHGLTKATAFAREAVATDMVRESLLAAEAALRPGQKQPWVLMEVAAGPKRARLARAADEKAATILADAPVVVVGFAGVERRLEKGLPAEDSAWDAALVSGGAALQNVALAFHAFGLACCWVPPTRFRQERARRTLGVADRLALLGAVAAGWPLAPV
jgi:dehydro coenzyme F420 reductase / coenzyme F420-0:L-glutamate ligase / coenzyme F420-1:gamma-L-glutamate ligase